MDVFSSLRCWASNETMWLPKNFTWEEMETLPHYPKASDLRLATVLAFGFLAIRAFFDRILYIPIGTAFGVRSKAAQVESIPLLEKAYNEKTIDKNTVEKIAIHLNWTVRQVEIWLRRKKKSLTPMKKFTEGAWRVTCYTSFVIYGTVVVWDEPCAFNISNCFQPVAKQQIPTAVDRWYSLLELGFYISLAVSILKDVRRKDFKIMMVHHFYTLVLISFSWMINAFRISNLVMLCHDIADIPLEITKLVGLIKRKPLSTIGFAVFLSAWVIGRLVYLPFLVYGCVVYGREYTGHIPYFVLNGLLVCLFQLHLMWTWMIIKVLYNMLITKTVVDVRSDDETCSDNETSKQKSN